MRAVVQRVSRAEVTVNGKTAGRIDSGLLVLLGVGRGDTAKDAVYLASKTAGLRIFGGSDGRMTKSVEDIGGSVLAISQFTLFGDVRRGLRPSFDGAADPETAESLYEEYVAQLRAAGLQVATGVFGAMMRVESVNEGPVTILLDSTKLL
ncbi:MAG: D-tyrosyl-tRNA(Tyr) deacylase [Acidobacteriia bacterium]|nr:D-tyrosyl-tRNA(Tyr) deacylase [Terriglobia bacterium]